MHRSCVFNLQSTAVFVYILSSFFTSCSINYLNKRAILSSHLYKLNNTSVSDWLYVPVVLVVELAKADIVVHLYDTDSYA